MECLIVINVQSFNIDVLTNLCKNGLPNGDLFEYASYMILNFEKKWKQKKAKELRDKVLRFREEKQKSERFSKYINNLDDKLNRSIELNKSSLNRSLNKSLDLNRSEKVDRSFSNNREENKNTKGVKKENAKAK